MASLEALNSLALAVRDAPSRASVPSVCRQLTEYLTTARGDALRDVFRVPLRAVSGRVLYLEVLSALFALDDALYPEGWLSHAASSSSRAKDATVALAAFLHPQGPLLSAVAWADADGGVTYTFPEEQLPERTKRLLRGGPQGVASLREGLPYSLCLEAASGGRPPPVRLTPGLYFLFWLACAPGRPGGRSLRLGATEVDPLLGPPKAASGGAPGHSLPLGAAKEKLTHAVGAGASLLQSVLHTSPTAPHGGAPAQAATPGGASLPTPASPLLASGAGAGVKLGHPYRELLQGLLNQLAPVVDTHSSGVAAGVSGQAAQQSNGGGQALGGGLRVSGDMLVAICQDFWLSDPDDVPPSPAPHGGAGAPSAGQLMPGPGLQLQRSGGGQLTQAGGMQPQAAARSWAFSPPQEDRVAAIRILVTHFHAVPPQCGTPPQPGGGSGAGRGGLSPAPSLGFRATTSALLSPRGHLAPSPSSPPSPLALACGLHPLGATLHRPLFSLLRKCFTAWPPDSHADMGAVLRLWTAVLTPWAFASPQQLAAAGGAGGGESPWSAYVAATSPFSLALTQHFAAHCCRRVQVAPADALSRAERGLAPLAALGDSLLAVLRDVEAGHNAAVADMLAGTPGGTGALPGGAWTSLGRRLAAMLGEWEAPAGCSGAEGGPQAAALLSASPPRTPLPGAFGGGGGFRLGGVASPSSPHHLGTPAASAAPQPAVAPLVVFDPHAGVGQWLAWMVERCDERCEAVPGTGQHGHHHGLHVPHRRPDTRTRLVNAIWAVTRVKVPPPQQAHTPGGPQRSQGGGDAAAAAALRLSRPGISSRMWADQDLGGRADGSGGDVMAWATMPIASYEVPWLVRLLVPLSLRINAALGLTSDVAPPWVAALPLPEAWHRAVATWRVNLRALAEKTTLGWLAALWLSWRCLAWLGGALAGAM